MTSLRALLLSLIAVVMAATGIGVGMARGAMAADGQLCSVTGPAPVVLAHDGLPLFDKDGAPVTLDRGACLDCVIAAIDLPPGAATAPPPGTATRRAQGPLPADRLPTRAEPGGPARAPPHAA